MGVTYAVVSVLISTAVEPYHDDLSSYVSSICLIALGPILFGQALANRARLNQALHAKAERAERERAAAAGAAALEERTRIAGELHDVVAHALSAMTVQSAARRMAERDPERAESAFSTVETTGRDALTELRRLLGVDLTAYAVAGRGGGGARRFDSPPRPHGGARMSVRILIADDQALVRAGG